MHLRTLAPALAMAVLSLGSTGCIKSALTNGQISATRDASGAFDSIGDYDLARSAAMAGLVQFEGMHKLAPDNEDALFLLVKGWVGYGFAFAEDDFEAADESGDDDAAEYHKKRARMAYDRAVFYGTELLGRKASGFDAARKNSESLKKWLDDHFDKDDLEPLFWFGYAWLARVNIGKDDPALVADLFVAVAFLDKARAIDPTYSHFGGLVALGAYHARNALAELDQAKALFEEALAKTQRKSLLVQVGYASKYACAKSDRALYEKLLTEVVEADDPDPSDRLSNAVAKRRAKRYLGKAHMATCGFVDAKK